MIAPILSSKYSWNPFAKNSKKDKGDCMSYVAPAVKEKFETLSVELKNTILDRNVNLNNIHDLINVLDEIVKEADAEDKQPVRR